MFLDKFIGALLPSFEKDRLINDIRITRGELDALKDAYSEAAKLLKSWKFQNSEVIDKVTAFKRIVGTSDNPIVFIDDHLKTVLENLEVAETQAAAILGAVVAGKGLTFKQGTIVQYCDALFLVTKYARKFLNYVYVMESLSFKEGAVATESIPKHELGWIDEKFLDFCNALKSTTDDPKKVLAGIEGIPEIEVASANLASLKSTVGDQTLDPLKLGFIASKYNPIYFVRMVVAEYQVRRYKEMKEEISLLSLRRMRLEKLKGGKDDANLEKQIEYVESRSQKLSYEIAQMELGK
jgi:hypothetical protein